MLQYKMVWQVSILWEINIPNMRPPSMYAEMLKVTEMGVPTLLKCNHLALKQKAKNS